MMRQVTKIGIAKPWRLTIILATGRAIRPAYEGIETIEVEFSNEDLSEVARSAPPMRGLKLNI